MYIQHCHCALRLSSVSLRHSTEAEKERNFPWSSEVSGHRLKSFVTLREVFRPFGHFLDRAFHVTHVLRSRVWMWGEWQEDGVAASATHSQDLFSHLDGGCTLWSRDRQEISGENSRNSVLCCLPTTASLGRALAN